MLKKCPHPRISCLLILLAILSFSRQVRGQSENDLQTISSDNVHQIVVLADFSIPTGSDGFLFNVLFSIDGTTLVTTNLDGKDIHVWDVAIGRQKGTLRGHIERIRKLLFSPDENLLASIGSDNTLRLWDINTFKEVLSLNGDRDSIDDMVFNSDGTLLAYVNGSAWPASENNNIVVWDTQKNKKIFTLNQAQVFEVAFSPEDIHLAAAGVYGPFRIWDLTNAEGPKFADIPINNEETVLNVIFSCDANTLAFQSLEGNLFLWNTIKQIIQTIPAFEVPIYYFPSYCSDVLAFEGQGTGIQLMDISTGDSLGYWDNRDQIGGRFEAINPDESVLVSIILVDNDRTKGVLWDSKSGTQLAILNHDTADRAVFSPNGKYIATWSFDGDIRIWGIPAST